MLITGLSTLGILKVFNFLSVSSSFWFLCSPQNPELPQEYQLLKDFHVTAIWTFSKRFGSLLSKKKEYSKDLWQHDITIKGSKWQNLAYRKRYLICGKSQNVDAKNKVWLSQKRSPWYFFNIGPPNQFQRQNIDINEYVKPDIPEKVGPNVLLSLREVSS